MVRDFPSELKPHVLSGPAYEIQGSTGRGMITASPWIATYDRRITDTATEGFYVAYLFSIDFKRLYLSLAFGTTQFAEYFKNIGERHEKLASAAAQFRTLVKPERTLYVDTLKLAATSKDRLHSDYQYSNIWAIQYDLNLVPQRTFWSRTTDTCSASTNS